MDDLIKFLADDKDEKFFLTEEEEREMLEYLPLAENKLSDVLIVW